MGPFTLAMVTTGTVYRNLLIIIEAAANTRRNNVPTTEENAYFALEKPSK
jgi:hypothetical protein